MSPTLDERATAAGLVFVREDKHTIGRTRYYADLAGRLFIGCWDAHEQFYWHLAARPQGLPPKEDTDNA